MEGCMDGRVAGLCVWAERYQTLAASLRGRVPDSACPVTCHIMKQSRTSLQMSTSAGMVTWPGSARPGPIVRWRFVCPFVVRHASTTHKHTLTTPFERLPCPLESHNQEDRCPPI